MTRLGDDARSTAKLQVAATEAPVDSQRQGLGLLALAVRAHQARAGMTAAKILMRSGKAKLVVLAVDATDEAKRTVTYLANESDIPVWEYPTCDELSKFFDGAAKNVLTILDPNIANGIMMKAGMRFSRTAKPHQRRQKRYGQKKNL